MLTGLVVQLCSCNACTSLTVATSDSDYTAIQAAADSSVCHLAFVLLLHRVCFAYTACMSPVTSTYTAQLLCVASHICRHHVQPHERDSVTSVIHVMFPGKGCMLSCVHSGGIKCAQCCSLDGGAACCKLHPPLRHPRPHPLRRSRPWSRSWQLSLPCRLGKPPCRLTLMPSNFKSTLLMLPPLQMRRIPACRFHIATFPAVCAC